MSEEAATMFDANEASSEPAETQAVETASEGERPDWLLDKFKSSEDQAKACRDEQQRTKPQWRPQRPPCVGLRVAW